MYLISRKHQLLTHCLVVIASTLAWRPAECRPPPTTMRPTDSAPSRRLVGRSLALEATAAQPQTPTTTQLPPPVPDFEAPIGNQTVAVGRDAQLSCRIRDLGNFRTAWLRVEDRGILTIHNNVITRNYRFGLLNNDDGREFVLTIRNVQPSDRGGYLCQINSVPMKYAIGYLDVLTPPAFEEESARPPDDERPAASPAGTITVTEGANTTISCRASGHPAPEITWRREDSQPLLPAGGSHEGVAKVEANSLALGPVSRRHAGAYLCIASNGVQPSASRRQVLDVQFAPTVRVPETEVGAALNEPELTLSCYVEANPAGDYHWVRVPAARSGAQTRPAARQEGGADGADDAALIEQEELASSDKFEIVIRRTADEKVQLSLTIRRVERSDFAWYKCIARNALGIQSGAVRLVEQSARTSGELNDQGARPPPAGRQHIPVLNARAHVRSSWIQRSTSGGSGRQFESQAPDSAVGAGSGSARVGEAHLLLMLLPVVLGSLLSRRPCYC